LRVASVWRVDWTQAMQASPGKRGLVLVAAAREQPDHVLAHPMDADLDPAMFGVNDLIRRRFLIRIGEVFRDLARHQVVISLQREQIMDAPLKDQRGRIALATKPTA
jgi:hypothetical protein